MRALRLRGARTNNLKGIDLDIEPGTFMVVTGPSGAGKSSLAFGTLYAEGQRRYVESFSAYARQFLERLARPPVDSLEPVPAAIGVDRRASVKTSRSTVATLTELSDYAKQLWAHAATLRCTRCGADVHAHTPQSAAEAVLSSLPGERVVVTYPVPVADAAHFLDVRESLVRDGYHRLWRNSEVQELDQIRPSDILGTSAGDAPVAKSAKARKRKPEPAAVAAAPTFVQVVTDRARAASEDKPRLVEALEAAFERGLGEACVATPAGQTLRFSRGLRCDECGAQYRRPTPGLFSYNSPIGACDACRGFGRVIDVDWDKVFPDHRKTLADGAIKPWSGKATQWERRLLTRYCARAGVPMNIPYEQLTAAQRRGLVEGDGGGWQKGYPGLQRWFKWLESRAYKMHVRVLLSRYRKYVECTACHGTRFKPEVLAYRVADRTLPEFYGCSVNEAGEIVAQLLAAAPSDPSYQQALRETLARLQTLDAVGLGYLTLDRSARTLSGGELQRVSLTSALGASLTGTLFVLDEPTVGLHPADVARLLPVVRQLAERDNIVVVVESDDAFVRAADRVVELGPAAGELGGQIVFDGTASQLQLANTATAQALREGKVATRAARKPGKTLRLCGATGNNLQGVELELPIAGLSCVTGVSGSGKSSLVLDTLVPAVAQALGDASMPALPFTSLHGIEAIKSLVFVDQSPLGRTSRGNPATYLGAWDVVRKHFAKAKLSVERGYTAGRFSFNVAGGRCEACKGEGAETVEMQFLSDVTFSCPQCGGKRFTGPVLDVLVAGKSVAGVLELSAREARTVFAGYPDICARLDPLIDVGAGYLRLGQSLNTLSGGEAQRLKLAAALADATSDALIVLDEPTAGLHAQDIVPLLHTLRTLCERGNTVVVVEHDMRLAAAADHVVDLGPGAGAAGGSLVVAGTPAQVASHKASRTAPFLRAALSGQAPPHVAPVAAATSDLSIGPDVIAIRGAREHNLKNVDVDIPRERLVVVTGPSGSGKSTLAFDVVFAESQRRYLETLSPYVRQYLKQLPRPAVDRVVGTPPGVSLEQRSTGGAKNSTVATVTEVAHYLRLLFARAGVLHCPKCAVAIAPRAPAELAQLARERFARAEVSVFAPVVRSRKGAHKDILARARRDGYANARIDGKLQAIEPRMSLSRFQEHDVEVLIGTERGTSAALSELVIRALAVGDGAVLLISGKEQLPLSTRRACPTCGTGYPELDPRFFSFNTQQGACSRCEGHGYLEVERRGREPERSVCPQCNGQRLAGLALHTTVDGAHIAQYLELSVEQAMERLARVQLRGRDALVGALPLREARSRLEFLQRVGLTYLTLDRPAWSLSGGELQRVRLAAQLGSGLTGLLYVLDEPTIGLHPRDTDRLLSALRELTAKGCSVLLVEHDAETIRAAEHVIDVGPGGGHEGGRILAQGTPKELAHNPDSFTFASLARPLAAPSTRRPVNRKRGVTLTGAREHNLKDVELWVPVGCFTAVTGVSGSGKSTLVRQVLLPALRAALDIAGDPPGAFRSLRGADAFRRAVEIDQTPIGRTPRSVPATYVGIWDEIRKLYAGTIEARARGYDASRFSFNVAKGRCSVCDGQGATSFEMSFLPEALVTCEGCDGRRFDPETLSILVHGVSAGDLLDRDVAEVAQLLAAVPKVQRPLDLLVRLGLGYLKLGQPSNTLSGGEAQRLKLVSELAASGGGPTLYVMDEPTTGLHREDVRRLLTVMQQLVDRGDTVVVIEHHPDVIIAADWVVDLGPEGGAAGGSIVAQGTPEDIMREPRSHTGNILQRELGRKPTARKARSPQVRA